MLNRPFIFFNLALLTKIHQISSHENKENLLFSRVTSDEIKKFSTLIVIVGTGAQEVLRPRDFVLDRSRG